LITGGTGFIGSRLIPALENRGYEVWALVRYVTGRYRLGENVKFVFADIRDYWAVKNAVRLVNPHYVIHLAAISPVSYSFEHPQEVTETNYIGTINLAEACLRTLNSVEQFIFAGTSEEYGDQTVFPITEKATIKPNTPYAISKASASWYLQYMMQAYGFPATIMRPFNTYGRTRNTHFVTERIITQMIKGERTVKLGDPAPVRDMVYVDDHVDAYLQVLGNSLALFQTFNVSTGKGVTIKMLATEIRKLTGWKGHIRWNTIPNRPTDIKTLIGDNAKIKNLIGWEPKYD